MNRHLFTLAFLLGALGIVWVGVGFIDSSFLALAMTAVIGAVYAFGALELHRFRQATSTLAAALAAIPEQLAELGDWLAGVHPSLQNPVRLRIEGERVGLPGPGLTPYLVGLLVMLGMLGTFLGMVVTLKGAVFALEKTTDLQAIRSALAVPVKGLGLAFGTSVAGVAASAMLGLMSALSRRERMLAAQLLDTKIGTVLRHFSLTHQRQETFKALQQQSQALPAVADQLRAMMEQMADMGQQLNQRLLSNQEEFHSNVKGVYTDLAGAVDKSLRESLSQSAHVAGESIKPVVEAAMSGIVRDAKLMHESMANTVQLQLDGLAARFSDTTSTVAETWTKALSSHEQANAGVVAGVGRALDAFSETFEQRSGALVSTVSEAYASLQTGQAEQDEKRQQAWTQSVEAMAAALKSNEQASAGIVADVRRSLDAFNETYEQRSGALVTTVSEAYASLQTNQAEQDQQRQQAWTQSVEAMAAALKSNEQASAGIVADVRRSLDAFNETYEQRSGALVSTVSEAYASLQTSQAEQDQQRQQAWTQSVEAMAAALKSNEQASAGIVADVRSSLDAFNETYEQRSGALVSNVSEAYASLQTTQAEQDQQRQQAWTQSVEAMAAALKSNEQASAGIVADVRRSLDAFSETYEQRSGALVSTVSEAYASLQTNQAEQDQQRQQAWTQSLEAVAATLTQELQQTGAQTLSQQQRICDTLTATVQGVTEQAQASAGATLGEAARLISGAEELMRSRIVAEAQWIEQHRERMDQLASLLRTELGALKEQEAVRGDAAVERLAQLQSAVTGHLTTLGAALEEPITRLIETASEAPRAAAEVIGQLRREVSSSAARDNELLEERSRIMATLNALLEAINHASVEQRAVIDSLVASSAVALNAAGNAFSENVADEAAKLSDIAAHVTSSAVEVSSLSEAFGFAVNSFNEANEKLIANLQRIEGAMDKSMARSDEQLAYYVAQAREIIDLSMASQKEVLDELRELPAKSAMFAEEGR